MLSIIIVHYDTPELTSNCLKSIYRHTSGLDFEVIVVDNASPTTDPEDLARSFPAVTLVRSDRNLGFAGGNNLGLSHSCGEEVLLLNSDVVLHSNAIGATWNRLVSDARVDAISPRLVYPDGRVQHTCRRLPSIRLLVLELTRLHRLLSPAERARILSGSYFAHDTECEVESVWAAFFMFKRSLLSAFSAGRLPASFFMYGEDTEWCLLLKRAGARILFYPEASAVHLVSASSGRDADDRKKQLIAHNRNLLLRRYRGRAYAEIYRVLEWIARHTA